MVSCSLTTFPVVSPPPWAAAVEVFERVLRLLPGATPRATCGAAECGAGPRRILRDGRVINSLGFIWVYGDCTAAAVHRWSWEAVRAIWLYDDLMMI
jgi:hypothetical protein